MIVKVTIKNHTYIYMCGSLLIKIWNNTRDIKVFDNTPLGKINNLNFKNYEK